MTRRILTMDLVIRLYASFSLKDKRKVRKSLCDRLRQRYNISIAETDYHDTLNTIGLSLAYVALNEATALEMEGTLQDNIDAILELDASGELIEVVTQIA